MDPNDKNIYLLTKEEYQLMNTKEENLNCLSPRKQNRANKYREIYEAMGTPTVDDLKSTIQMNIIKKNKVTIYELNLATKVNGPDVEEIEGKTTRSRLAPFVSNIVEIPK